MFILVLIIFLLKNILIDIVIFFVLVGWYKYLNICIVYCWVYYYYGRVMVFFVRVFGLDFSFEFGLEKIFFYLNYDFFLFLVCDYFLLDDN